MSFFRSSLVVAILSAMLLTAFGVDIIGDCCVRDVSAEAAHCDCTPQEQPHGDSDGSGCQCLCHITLTPLLPDAMRIAATGFIAVGFASHADEFPPDAVPLGIEHPPQIG